MIPVEDRPATTAPPADAAAAVRRGVLLIGHGTRDPLGTEQFFALAAALGRQLAPVPVQPCLLELQPPNIAEGWRRLVGQGVEHIHAVPLLLFAAGHARADIPAALAACHRETPTIRWAQARPLSRCPELLALVLRRLDAVFALGRFDPERTALVMVGRGSHDPCAQADMKLLAHCVAGRRTVRRVATAFYAMSAPKLPLVLDQLAADRSIESIIVQPHVLFEGAIYRGIGELVSQSQARHRHCRHGCANYLGPEPELAAALLRRVAESPSWR